VAYLRIRADSRSGVRGFGGALRRLVASLVCFGAFCDRSVTVFSRRLLFIVSISSLTSQAVHSRRKRGAAKHEG
jgi:hypothetical protein